MKPLTTRLSGLFFLLVALCLPNFLVAQTGLRITARFEAQSLHSAIRQLEQSYQLNFAYDQALLENIIIEKIQLKAAGLENALQQLLSPYQLDFEIAANGYILISRSKSPPIGEIEPPGAPPAMVICGTIRDSLTGEALAYATIGLSGTNRGVGANAGGDFRLEGPFVKTDTLQFSYVGYQTLRLPASPLVNRACPTILLAPAGMTMAEVIIAEPAVELLEAAGKGAGVQFRPDKMGVLPGWGDNDVLRMAQLLPGINAVDESAANLHIRGGTPDQNLILWDGIPIYHTGHFFGMLSAFNPYLVDRAEIYAGGFGARYGGRVSGIIDIHSEPRSYDSLEVAAGFNLLSGHVQVKIPLAKGRVALLVAGRHSSTDSIKSQIYQNLFAQIAGRGKIEDDQRRAEETDHQLKLTPVLNFSDFNVKLIGNTRKGSEWALSMYRANDNLNYLVTYDQPWLFLQARDLIDLDNGGLSTSWQRTWSPQSETRARLVVSTFRNDYRYQVSLHRDQAPDLSIRKFNEIKEGYLLLEHTWKLREQHRFTLGYQGTRQDVIFQWTVDQPGNAEIQQGNEAPQGTTTTAYFDYDYEWPDHFQLDWGFRLNRFSAFDKPVLEPRLSADWQPFQNPFHVKASLGRHVQYVVQMFVANDLGLGEQFWALSGLTGKIPPIISDQFSFGLRWQKKHTLIDLEYYRKQQSGLTTINFSLEPGQENPFSGGQADIRGVDFLYKQKWGRYSQWLSYSWGNVTQRFDQLNGDQPFPADHDQRHTVKWTHQLVLPHWEFSLSWHYGSGRPYTQASGIETRYLETEQEYEHQVVYEPLNSRRLPAYHRLDLSASYHFKSRRRFHGMCGLSFFNLYDRSNVYDRDFYAVSPEDDPSQAELVRYNQDMLGFTPNLFLELEW